MIPRTSWLALPAALGLKNGTKQSIGLGLVAAAGALVTTVTVAAAWIVKTALATSPHLNAQAPIGPAAAFYSADLNEFVVKYDDIRAAPSPRQALLEFLQTAYDAGANLAKWDRAALERS